VSAKSVNVVVTCTKRKRHPVARTLQLRTVPGKTVTEVVENWVDRLETTESPTVSAEDLYAGDQWHIAKSLPELGLQRGLRVRLWVCSAGYGLIPASAPVRAYSATFSLNHPDSVLSRFRENGGRPGAEWWNCLKCWSGPRTGEPRSFGDLARRYSRDPLLVVASPIYLKAVQGDLKSAMQSLRDPELLIVVSAGVGSFGSLSPWVLPCDARLQRVLGGALMSLNVRIARRILTRFTKWPLRCCELSRVFKILVDRQPPLVIQERRPRTDSQVRQFIGRHLRRNANIRHTPLLRLLRDQGLACEQKRFHRLFDEMKGKVRGK